MEKKEILTGRNHSSGRTTAQLVVDREDSFFFDHALDHVPGILVITGLLDLIRTESSGIPPDWRVRMSLEFHRFCELDDDITLSITPLTPEDRQESGNENEPGWNLRAEIGTDVAVSGTAVLGQKPSAPLVPAAPGQTGTSLPTAELSHRSRPENCLVDEAWWAEDRLLASARKPPAGHLLRDRPLEQLIETSRQFATLIGHAGYERPSDSKFILRTLEADLPPELPADDVRLEWVPRPRKGRAFDLAMRLYHPSGDGLDTEVGSAHLDTLIVDPRQYETIRFRRRRTEDDAR
ncbi:AfsA-related hotdog domain-containing protein [Streptomyces sp. NPDC026672]|uniref:AfsA-related hotdog domain-containing protein n=1 Tax=unclassified Streptomyces TaxID=2593676 RepID=UPI0034054E1E